jgi:hypothetical protein
MSSAIERLSAIGERTRLACSFRRPRRKLPCFPVDSSRIHKNNFVFISDVFGVGAKDSTRGRVRSPDNCARS